jgi:diguanylate cyclase (GGDEF)-like protein
MPAPPPEPAGAVGGVHELATAALRLEAPGSLDDVVGTAAALARELLAATVAAVCRIEQDTCRVLGGSPATPRDVRELALSRASFRAEVRPALRGLIRSRRPWVAHAVAPDGTVYTPGDPAAGDPAEAETLLQLGMAGALAVPIVVHGAVWGQIYAARRDPRRRFGDDEVAVAAVLAAFVAGAIARVDLESQVRHLVAEDALTGLASRRAADAAVARALTSGQETCVVMCDVDGLKRVNDELGHDAGDDLLRSVADVLRRVAEALPGAVAARIGGDEFCVVTVGSARSQVGDVVARTLTAFPLPHGAAVSYGVSSTAVTGAVSARQLFRRADAAQYRAKRARARLREIAGGVKADPMVTAERLVATCAPAITAAGQGVVSRLCGFAAAATEVLGGGDWAVLVHPAEGVPPAVVARGGSPSGAPGAAETLVVGFGEWTVQVGASPTAATGPVVVTTLESLLAVAARAS